MVKYAVYFTIILLFLLICSNNSIGNLELTDNIIYPHQIFSDDKVTLKSNELTKNNPIEIKTNMQARFISNSYTYNHFTENKGQLNNDKIKFYCQNQNLIFLTNSIIFELTEFEIIKIIFSNSNHVIPTGDIKLDHKSNFFYGNDSNKWITGVSNYGEIVYRNIYDNIDLRYYFHANRLKYDFLVHAGGDPAEIVMKIEGTTGISFDKNNNIKIKTESNELIDKDLFVYQKAMNNINIISSSYKLIDIDSYGFNIMGTYNKNEILIIDPLIYSTYLGGSNDESTMDIIVDNNNNVHVTGWTYSQNFPVKNDSYNTTYNGNKDIFILKLKSDGRSLIYSTFIGGNKNETPHSIEKDIDGNIYIAGETNSENFPTTPDSNDTKYNGGYDIFGDAFVFKLNFLGDKLEYSTYIGGDSWDYAYDITIDKNKNAYITGQTESNDFPTTPGVYDNIVNESSAFITKLNHNGSIIVYSTFLGGNLGNAGISITLDINENIYITGATTAGDFPTTTNAYKRKSTLGDIDIFVSKLNYNLSTLLFSTLIGGPMSAGESELGVQIILDNNQNIIIVGYTNDDGYPISNDAYDSTHNGIFDVFISKLNSNLSSLLYSTFIGGRGEDLAYDAEIDSSGNVYIVGETNSSDFPVLEGVYDSSYNGNRDAFVIKLNLTSSTILYSTFIGSNSDDIARAISLFDDRYVCIGGQAGQGFPTTDGSFSPEYNGGNSDAFILKVKTATAPTIIDIKTSQNIVYRSKFINLYSNASDIEDNEQSLLPHFEYLSPDQMIWRSDYIDKLSYQETRWQARFVAQINASLGYYHFRIRYNDTDGIFTKWIYLNNSLLVKNNPPLVIKISISNHITLINQALCLYSNVSDIENEINYLTLQPEYKYASDQFWKTLDYNKIWIDDSQIIIEFSFDYGMLYGPYDIRVRVNDSDYDFSNWYYINESINLISYSPELLSIMLPNDNIKRTEYFEVFINCSDADSPNNELFVELQYSSELIQNWNNLSVDEINNRWEAYGKSKKNWMLGNYSFRARAIDYEENISPWFYLNNSLKVLNNIPEILEITNVPANMDRKTSTIIEINAKDVEDIEADLNLQYDYKAPGSALWTDDFLSEPYYEDNAWKVKFTLPFDAPVGDYSFRTRVQDLNGDWSDYHYLKNSMSVQNIAPDVLSFYQTPSEIFRTSKILISAEGSDWETEISDLECIIQYLESGSLEWTDLITNFNNTTQNWDAILQTTISSSLGNYSFRVQFIDSDGAYSKQMLSNESVWIKNNLPEISDDLDEISVGKTQYILKLTEYGYDVETSKGDLRWQVDFSSIDTKLFHIEDGNIENQEITIYPVKGKIGKDDITIMLIDADNGKAVKKDITINVNSKTGGVYKDPDEETPIGKFTESSYLWVYLLIIIILIIFILIFIFSRRRKKGG